MKLRSDLFPYPVLSNELDDFSNGKFNVSISQKKISVSRFLITFDFQLENEDLQNLILEKKAKFAIHLEGKSSSYRNFIYLENGETIKEVELESGIAPKKIFANVMIVATEKIINYKNSGFNKDYYGENLVIPEVEKGSILAYDTMAELNIDFSNSENPNVKSMIRVASIDNNYMEVDLDGDTIRVNLPRKSYYAYVNLSNSSKEQQQLLLVTIILPALTMAIESVKQNIVDETKEWYEALGHLLSKINYDIEDLKGSEENSLTIAQQLLDFPLENALYNYYSFIEEKN